VWGRIGAVVSRFFAKPEKAEERKRKRSELLQSAFGE
jgi:hypothetical protein